MSTVEKKQISVNGILGMLADGRTREEIAGELSLSKAELRAVFQHSKLKNKKTKVNHLSAIELIDDTEPAGDSDTISASVNEVPKAKGRPKAVAIEPTPEAEPTPEEALPETEQLADEPAPEAKEVTSPWAR